MSDIPGSPTTPPEGYGEWLADLKGRIQNAQATALSWRKNHSD
ncbi:hypothetical protein PSEUDT2_04256 [Stutzerimonas stutzeri]|nr:hypothetical protein PSEUDT2_04256 [Stutzerimonas stutzeri]